MNPKLVEEIEAAATALAKANAEFAAAKVAHTAADENLWRAQDAVHNARAAVNKIIEQMVGVSVERCEARQQAAW